LHRHKVEEQVYHVLDGQDRTQIDGEHNVVRKHDVFFLPHRASIMRSPTPGSPISSSSSSPRRCQMTPDAGGRPGAEQAARADGEDRVASTFRSDGKRHVLPTEGIGAYPDRRTGGPFAG
jgi:hypothetical protein